MDLCTIIIMKMFRGSKRHKRDERPDSHEPWMMAC